MSDMLQVISMMAVPAVALLTMRYLNRRDDRAGELQPQAAIAMAGSGFQS
jgi:hypothetical protein